MHGFVQDQFRPNSHALVTKGEPLVVIHNKDTRQNGIIPSRFIKFLSEDSNMKKKYGLGYISPEGQIYRDSVISNNANELVVGSVSLELGDGGYEFIVRSQEELQQYLKDNKDIYMRESLDQKGRTVYSLINFYRSSAHFVGDGITLMFQQFQPSCVPMESLELLYPGKKADLRNLIKEIRERNGVTVASEEAHKNIRKKIDAAAMFIWQLASSYSYRRLKGKYDGAVTPLAVSEDFLNLFLEDNVHSFNSLNRKLSNLIPLEGDPLFRIGSPVYTEDAPHYDSNHPLFWENLINRIKVVDGKAKLNLKNEKNDKLFWKSWLLLIQNDLQRGEASSGLFEGYRDTFEGRSFSEGIELNKVPSDDFSLISDIMDFMIREFGYPVYLTLSSGLSKVSVGKRGVKIDFLHPGGRILSELFSRHKLKRLSSDLGEFEYYSPKSTVLSEGSELSSTFTNLLLFGQIQGFEGYKKFNGINQKHKENIIHYTPSETFLMHYFNDFVHKSPKTGLKSDWLIISRYYSAIGQLFIKKEVNSLLESDSKDLSKINTLARRSIFSKISRKIDLYLDPYFDLIGKLPYWGFNEFKENPSKWLVDTKRMFNNIARMFIANPSRDLDIIEQMRNAYIDGEGCIIELQCDQTSNTIRARAYDKNPLIKEGISIEFSHNELREIFKVRENIITSVFTHYSHNAPKNIEYKFMNKKGYFLDFNHLWNDEMKEKIKQACIQIEALFEHSNAEDFTIKFYVGKGGGIDRSKHLQKSYGERFGFKDNGDGYKTSTFKNTPAEIKKGVQTAIFYTFVFGASDVFALCHEGKQGKLVFGLDIFGAYTADFISENLYNDRSVKTAWEDNPEIYRHFMAEYSAIFNEEDIQFFLGFHNNDNNIHAEGSGRIMLEFIWQKFKEFLYELGRSDEIYDFTEDGYLA